MREQEDPASAVEEQIWDTPADRTLEEQMISVISSGLLSCFFSLLMLTAFNKHAGP
jgi:hypothetical protein